MAEHHYFRALNIKPFEKLYEYIAWVRSNVFANDYAVKAYAEKCL
jgi:hypothetical protein